MNSPLEVEEEAADVGTGDTASVQASAASASPPPNERKRRVLLVVDEESVIASLRRLLRREPYELASANSGAEALRLLEEQPVQLVVSDQRMPEMTGIELLQEVRRRWPDTIRVILSGYSVVKTIIEAINEGAVYKFLSKPWNDEEIKTNIRRALEQYELQAENRRLAREIAEQNERLRELNVVLDQRAADATAGLSSIQNLQEAIAVGVITFDESGLIVATNRLANEMIAPEAELFGVPAREALPDPVYRAFFPEGRAGQETTSGHLEYGGRLLQWRLQCVGDEGNLRGRVATFGRTYYDRFHWAEYRQTTREPASTPENRSPHSVGNERAELVRGARGQGARR